MKRLIASFVLWGMMVVAMADERPRNWSELMKAFSNAEWNWSDELRSTVGADELRWRAVQSLSDLEIEIAGKSDELFKTRWDVPVLRRWGMIAPKEALTYFLDQFYRARLDWLSSPHDWTPSLRGTDRLFDAPQIAASGLKTVYDGWAQKDAKAAWRHFLDLENEHRKVGLFHPMIRETEARDDGLFRQLAKADPYFAMSEFQRAGLSEELGVGLRLILLEALVKEWPENTEWGLLFRRLENEVSSDSIHVLRLVHGPLLGRWMKADVNAAEKWFRRTVTKGTFKKLEPITWRGESGWSRTYDEPMTEVTLASAASYWLLSEPKDAMIWLRDHKKLVPEVLASCCWRCGSAERRICRQTLVFCLNQMERNELLTQMALKSFDNRGIEALVSEAEETAVDEIAELKLSAKTSAIVRNALFKRRGEFGF